MLNFKNIKTIKFNNFLNYKIFDSFKIIRIINKIVYELEFFDSMKNIFFDVSFMIVSFERQRLVWQSNTRFVRIHQHNWRERVIREWNYQFKNKKSQERSRYWSKKLFSVSNWFCRWQRKIKIQRRKWQIFIDVKNVLYFVVDFHHKYFDKSKSHVIFQKLDDWISLSKKIINIEEYIAKFSTQVFDCQVRCCYEKSKNIRTRAQIENDIFVFKWMFIVYSMSSNLSLTICFCNAYEWIK